MPLGRWLWPAFTQPGHEAAASHRKCAAWPQVNLYDRLGLDTLQKFSTAFYTSFYKDKPYYE